MYVYHNIENDLVIDVKQIYHRAEIMEQMKKKFLTFGYKEIETATFEPYDLYVHMQGTVNLQEMTKTIDNNGNVLVLRPDVTIPLTKQISLLNKEIHEDLRYFYVLDVFRQTIKGNLENTQAGVEYFGNQFPEADAEIIALSIELLQDIHLQHVKIELGHAGFFKQLALELNMNETDLAELKNFIQAKNGTEIEQLLHRLSVCPKIKEIVTSLPFLYGEPTKVIQKAKKLPLSDAMISTLENLATIYEGLKAYGVSEHIVIDLSLINHMDYYSDMIFQGFIANIGKPVLMGGRYDTLAEQFGAKIPAIGFACDVDLLLENMDQPSLKQWGEIDVGILYAENAVQQGLSLARQLRKKQFQVITYPNMSEKSRMPKTSHTIEINSNSFIIKHENETTTFRDMTKVIAFLQKERE